MPRKRKESKEEPYFGEKEEAAVIRYMTASTLEEKNKIYNKELKRPFKKLVSSILRTYPNYIGSNDINDIENDGLRHVITQLHLNKFDATKGLKAYSYFGTIARNYFRTTSKTIRKETINDQCFDDYFDEFESDINMSYEIDRDTPDYSGMLFETTLNSIKNEIRTNKGLKINEIKVGEAVINIFERWEEIFPVEDGKTTNNFAKKRVLLFIKEQTMLDAKEIRDALGCYKSIYLLNKKDLVEDDDE